ncbi:MAG TPA: M1 family metallopeptidase [Flavipsychrobacter sp.]|nr:M1 family metallopeptidase [Flavipsychrobacter sp.]
MMRSFQLTIGCLLFAGTLFGYTRQDTLRGSNGLHRAWWDVKHYALTIELDTSKKSISGRNVIGSKIVSTPTDSLQLDLQELLFLDSVVMDGKPLVFFKDGNVWWVKHPFYQKSQGSEFTFSVYYHGKPPIAKNPPWDGGFIWTKDSVGNPWIAVACQGLGASSWWPCKDYQGDEPDSGMSLSFFPSILKLTPLSEKHADASGSSRIDTAFQIISNGKDESISVENPGKDDIQHFYAYNLSQPVNTYNATFYMGDYTNWEDTLIGEKGVLNLSFYPLRSNEQKARKQFAVTKDMLRCFEYWMGPYPFYEDGYKLVEAPYLGMEHQSAVAYGNGYKMGYKGSDRSHTGVGMLFDYIIIHESGHEWFGNNITARDVADNWIHEGFTTYTETLFAEWVAGKEKAFEYCRGEWKNIVNDRPIIGDYGVNDDGSRDKYDKGAALIHMIRVIISNDQKFRQLLRGLNQEFYHGVVTTRQVEDYINRFTGYDFSPLFNQYLRTIKIPVLEYYIQKKKLHYRFTEVVEDFTLPVEVRLGKRKATIRPAEAWQEIKWKRGFGIEFSKDFLMEIK